MDWDKPDGSSTQRPATRGYRSRCMRRANTNSALFWLFWPAMSSWCLCWDILLLVYRQFGLTFSDMSFLGSHSGT